MPNCNFFGSREDHAGLLKWLYDEGTCEVHELASAYGQPLRCFRSAQEVDALFDERYPTGDKVRAVHLQLYVLGAGPPFVPTRVSINPESCGGATFRYSAEGWGLVQFYLSTVWRGELEYSHTNHFTQAGAGAWAPVRQEVPDVPDWDFKRITSFSSRLNREIKKRSVGKIGSSPVLRGALDLWKQGVPLAPYRDGTVPLVLKPD